jgi:hypothetical protein
MRNLATFLATLVTCAVLFEGNVLAHDMSPG